MSIFTDERTRISITVPDGWLINRAASLLSHLGGDVAAFASADGMLRVNIIVGSCMGINTLEQNRKLFEEFYAGSILKEGILILGSTKHFTGVYAKGGMIHKRYIIIHGGNEYALACAAHLETLEEFEKKAEPVFDGIASSCKFL